MNQAQPPRIACRLLRLFCRDDAGRDAVADLDEEFADVARRHGFLAARRWYRRQVARSVGARIHTGLRRRAAHLVAFGGALARLLKLGTDLGPAVRALRRAPWYALTSVLVVALAMALATTVFAVVDSVLFKPLPWPDGHQIVQVQARTESQVGSSGFFAGNASLTDLRAWREAVPEIEFTATTFGGAWALSDNESIRVATVDRNFFEVLGVQPLLGGFNDDDFGPRSDIQPALLSYALWQHRFGGDPGVIGQVFADRNGEGIRVAGVLRPDFVFPHVAISVLPPEALLPLFVRPPEWAQDPQRRFLHVVGRVPDDMPRAVVAERLTATTGAIAALFPPMSDEDRVSFRGPFAEIRLWALRDGLTRNTATVSRMSLGAAAFLVLLAGLNLAGLAGSRVLDRRRELSLRRALGASAADVIRVVVAEQVLLLAAGAAAGVALAWWLLRAAPWLLPADFTVLNVPAIDARALAASAAGCGLALATVAAWTIRIGLRADLRPALASAAGATERARSAGRRIIIGGQVGLAVAMVIAGTLFASSLVRLWSEDTGFQVDRAAVLQVQLPGDADLTFVDGVLASVRRQPGVTEVGGLGGPFLQRAISGSSFVAPPDALETGDVQHLRVTAGTLAALGLEPMAGRLPSGDEYTAGRPVLAISDTVARRYFPGRQAVGQILSDEDGRPFEVVGVVPDIRYRSLDSAPEGEIYSFLSAHASAGISSLIVAYRDDAAAGLAGTLGTLRAQAPELRVRSAMTMRQKLGMTVQSRQFQTATFVGFGVAGLVIAVAGILGVVAMSVSRRTREVGIRMSLGATPGGVVALVLREQTAPVLAGLAAGSLIAAWAARTLGAYLYEMSAYDWRVWTAAVLAMLAAALTAAWLPAQRASRIDPVRALRSE